MDSNALPTRIQDLPPAWAKFCLGFERFLLRDLALPLRDQSLLLACSAGSDSTALLLILRCLAPRLGVRVNVAHLDHRLRPESALEADHLGRLCQNLGVRFIAGASNVARYAQATGTGLEEAGRILRYRFLFGVRKRIGAGLLLTAHHADDLAEDVLMRLVRGTGWPALSGMSCWDPVRLLLRPLLHTPKQRLRNFLHDVDIEWMEDAGNADQDHFRNRIRSQVLPLLVRENPKFLSGIIRLHKQGEQDTALFHDLISPLVRQDEPGDFLESSRLATLHPGLRLRLYKTVIDALGPGQVLHDALLRLDLAWRDGAIGARIQFPGGKHALVVTQGIQFHHPSSTPSKEIPPCD